MHNYVFVKEWKNDIRSRDDYLFHGAILNDSSWIDLEVNFVVFLSFLDFNSKNSNVIYF